MAVMDRGRNGAFPERLLSTRFESGERKVPARGDHVFY
jgi:hypothetical protein